MSLETLHNNPVAADSDSFTLIFESLSEHNLNLREKRETDANFLHTLFSDVRGPELPDSGLDPAVIQSLLPLQYRAQQATLTTRFPAADHYIIETPSGDTIGQILIDQPYSGPLHLVDIALLSGWRRRGIGSCILRALQAAASRRSTALQLSVACNNPALALYQRLNFIETTRSEMYVCMVWNADIL